MPEAERLGSCPACSTRAAVDGRTRIVQHWAHGGWCEGSGEVPGDVQLVVAPPPPSLRAAIEQEERSAAAARQRAQAMAADHAQREAETATANRVVVRDFLTEMAGRAAGAEFLTLALTWRTGPGWRAKMGPLYRGGFLRDVDTEINQDYAGCWVLSATSTNSGHVWQVLDDRGDLWRTGLERRRPDQVRVQANQARSAPVESARASLGKFPTEKLATELAQLVLRTRRR